MLHRDFRYKSDGFYVDVGAADPIRYSLTAWTYFESRYLNSSFTASLGERPSSPARTKWIQ
jgi:hypothetical protein